MASHSPHSSLTSYDDDDINDDAWANFDLSGAIDQHQRCSSSQPTATLGRSSPTQFAGAATTGAAASSMCDDDIDDDAWANFDLSGAIEQHRRSMGSQPTAATAPGAALFPHAGRARNMQEGGEQINLKVVTQGGNETYFKCKETTPLKKLMDAFCNRQGVSTYSVFFLFDGNRIHERQTPEQLDMEDGDVIDVMFEQQGNVGEWEPAHTSSGAEQLLLSTATEDVDPATARDIERTASGPHLSRRAPPASFESVGALLTTAQCARLVAHTERLASELPPAQRAAPDAKLDVSAEELAQLVGPGVLASLMRLGAAQLSEAHLGLGLGLG